MGKKRALEKMMAAQTQIVDEDWLPIMLVHKKTRKKFLVMKRILPFVPLFSLMSGDGTTSVLLISKGINKRFDLMPKTEMIQIQISYLEGLLSLNKLRSGGVKC